MLLLTAALAAYTASSSSGAPAPPPVTPSVSLLRLAPQLPPLMPTTNPTFLCDAHARITDMLWCPPTPRLDNTGKLTGGNPTLLLLDESGQTRAYAPATGLVGANTPQPALSHTLLGDELLTLTPSACFRRESELAEHVRFAGAVARQGSRCTSVSGRRALVATPPAADGGEWSLLLLNDEGDVETLLGSLPRVRGLCVSADESALFLSTDDAILCARLDLDAEAASRPVVWTSLADATDLAMDVDGNVYACTAEGVRVLDEAADDVLLIETGGRTESLCFGGEMSSTLYVAVRGEVWSLSATVSGALTRSEEVASRFARQLGGQRHDGW